MKLDQESLLLTVPASTTLQEIENFLKKFRLGLRFSPTTSLKNYKNLTIKKILSENIHNLHALRYGEIDDICLSLTAKTSLGKIQTKSVPRSATGPDLKKIFIGSHGKYGEILEATLRVVPLPEKIKKISLKFHSQKKQELFLRTLWAHGLRPARLKKLKNTLILELEGLSEVVDTEYQLIHEMMI